MNKEQDVATRLTIATLNWLYSENDKKAGIKFTLPRDTEKLAGEVSSLYKTIYKAICSVHQEA